MAEVEVGGIKFRGGKIFVILTALTTAGGALWGGFEFYKDYLNMKDQIQNYTAPDLSGFDKRIDLVQQEVTMLQSEMGMILEEVQLVADVAKELKNDLKSDVRRIETIVEDVEQRVKEDSRDNEKELKTTIDNLEADVEKVEDKLTTAMKELQESIDKQIKTTLANPLSQMTK
jgi:phage terminase small subunit|tara:strand:- start:823 stop:1341 length:519 start_codon:yes stop_codon:yes gene_type:complete